MSKAYLSTTQAAVKSVTRTVLRGSEVIGVVGIDISLKKLTDLIKSIKLGCSGYLVLIQDDGVIPADPKYKDYNFKKVTDIPAKHLAELFSLFSGDKTVLVDGKESLGIVVTSPKTGWKFVGVIETQELMAPVKATIANLAYVGVIGLALIAAMAWQFSSRMIISPLRLVSEFLEGISRGNYAHRVRHARTDGIGSILDALNATAEVLGNSIEEIKLKTQDAEQKALAAEQATKEAEDAGARLSTPRVKVCSRRPRNSRASSRWWARPQSSFPPKSRSPAVAQRRRPNVWPKRPRPWRR